MAILMVESFGACRNGLFIPRNGTPVTIVKKTSNEVRMPTHAFNRSSGCFWRLPPLEKSLERTIGYTMLHLSCLRGTALYQIVMRSRCSQTIHGLHAFA